MGRHTRARARTHNFRIYCSDSQVCSCFYSDLFSNVVAHFFDLTSHNFVAALYECMNVVIIINPVCS
jgi:hypothetical protein